eukprot:3132872-Heterocapsa_arctica.AAC.1
MDRLAPQEAGPANEQGILRRVLDKALRGMTPCKPTWRPSFHVSSVLSALQPTPRSRGPASGAPPRLG